MKATELAKKPHLYLDMDGVQADFFTAWAQHHGKNRYKEIGDKAAREASITALNQKGPEFVQRFFSTLPVLPGGQRLINWVKANGIPFTVLSAPLRNNHEASIAGKRTWLDRHNPGTSADAIFTGQKERLAQHGGQPTCWWMTTKSTYKVGQMPAVMLFCTVMLMLTMLSSNWQRSTTSINN